MKTGLSEVLVNVQQLKDKLRRQETALAQVFLDSVMPSRFSVLRMPSLSLLVFLASVVPSFLGPVHYIAQFFLVPTLLGPVLSM